MNRPFFFFLTGLCLLLLALACKHTPDMVVPVVTPPDTTVPTSTTYTVPTDLVTAYADVPQPPADCRIVKLTYKGVNYAGPVLNPEEVSVGGETFKISTKYTITYQYDSQRRLIWQRRLFSTGQPDSTHYIYSPGQVLAIINQYDQAGKSYDNKTIVYLVDGRGYPRTIPGEQEVDADGFIVRVDTDNKEYWMTNTIKDLNIISSSTYIAGGFGIAIDTVNYYSTRPALPALTPFTGRSGRNLLARDVISAIGSTFWKDGKKTQENFIYQFDSKGRIKREVIREVRLSGDSSFRFYTDGIGVTDYEYDCP